jgi:hypothetical protein
VVYAPLLAARILLGRVARPALVLGGMFGIAKGALHLVAMRGNGPAQLLALLRGVGVETAQIMDVLVKVATRAARNQGFRRAFIRWVGVSGQEGLAVWGWGESMCGKDGMSKLWLRRPGHNATLLVISSH